MIMEQIKEKEYLIKELERDISKLKQDFNAGFVFNKWYKSGDGEKFFMPLEHYRTNYIDGVCVCLGIDGVFIDDDYEENVMTAQTKGWTESSFKEMFDCATKWTVAALQSLQEKLNSGEYIDE